ncbi:helix-turn-helix domain-containing protein [Orrella sp. JC864]|uniref:helix-turn-helix domain-containing protein n=1 Tax=Orrella sp. JC864 TaxID=3120298 RepID=UPI00300ADD91
MPLIVAPSCPAVRHRVLNLDEVRPDLRFSQWQEWMDDMIDVLPARRMPVRPYQGRLELHAVGEITLSLCRSEAMRLKRSLARISRDGHRDYVFQFILSGKPGMVRAYGQDTIVRRGDILAIDFDEPIEMERPAYEALALFVPRALMAPLLVGAQIHARVLRGGQGMAALATAWMGQYLRELPRLTAAEAHRALVALLPLLSECYAGSPASSGPAPGAAHHGLLGQLLAFVDSHWDDPDITPETLRERFGLSRRQLYAAFEPCKEGPATLIRRRRLAAARTELVQQPNASIAQVAYGCGFSSLSDFGRAFRREYGLSPSALRASAQAGRMRVRPLADPRPYARYLAGAHARPMPGA